MVEEVRRFMYQLMRRVDGLHAIAITDRDGVPALKVADDKAPDLALRPKFLSKASLAIDRASKLGLNTNKAIIAVYNSYQVVSVNQHPWIVTMIAEVGANTGMIMSLVTDLQDILQDLRTNIEVP